MTVSLDVFLPAVLANAPTCPKAVARKMILRAAIRLCEDSDIWREDLAADDVVILIDDYTITPPTGTRVINLISVRYDDVPLHAKTEEELDATDYGWRKGSSGTPFAYIIPEPNRFKFNRVPDRNITCGLKVRVSLKPIEGATTLGDILYNDWHECIRTGALHYLMEQKGAPWYNLLESQRYGKYFNTQLQRARVRLTTGHTRGPASAVMQPF